MVQDVKRSLGPCAKTARTPRQDPPRPSKTFPRRPKTTPRPPKKRDIGKYCSLMMSHTKIPRTPSQISYYLKTNWCELYKRKPIQIHGNQMLSSLLHKCGLKTHCLLDTKNMYTHPNSSNYKEVATSTSQHSVISGSINEKKQLYIKLKCHQLHKCKSRTRRSLLTYNKNTLTIVWQYILTKIQTSGGQLWSQRACRSISTRFTPRDQSS